MSRDLRNPPHPIPLGQLVLLLVFKRLPFSRQSNQPNHLHRLPLCLGHSSGSDFQHLAWGVRCRFLYTRPPKKSNSSIACSNRNCARDPNAALGIRRYKAAARFRKSKEATSVTRAEWPTRCQSNSGLDTNQKPLEKRLTVFFDDCVSMCINVCVFSCICI